MERVVVIDVAKLARKAVGSGIPDPLSRPPGPRNADCPDCGVPVVRASSCAYCPACGWGRCG